MSTAQEIINKSSKKAGLLARGGQQLESDINTDVLDLLNLMLERWRNNGVDLGLPTLSLTTELIIDGADEETIVIQLALRIIADFNRPQRAGLAAAGSSAFTELQAKYSVITEMTLDKSLTYKRYDSAYNILKG